MEWKVGSYLFNTWDLNYVIEKSDAACCVSIWDNLIKLNENQNKKNSIEFLSTWFYCCFWYLDVA